MSQTAPFRYSHKLVENVVVQDLTDWSGEIAGMDAVESAWRSHVSRPEVSAAVTEFDSDMALCREARNHLAAEWCENAGGLAVEKIGFVSAGTEPRVVSPMPAVQQDVRIFGSLGEAIEWAKR